MRQSFVSGHNLSSLCLGDYQNNIHHFRTRAINCWRDNCVTFRDKKGFEAEIPPPFFLDKYSFRRWLDEAVLSANAELVSVPETNFSELFEAYDETVRQSVVGSKMLGTRAPAVDEPIARSAFLDDQFSAWQSHLSHNNIDLPSETIDWYFSVPLLEVYRKSVFYPRFPVLWGPNYFGRISDQDRQHILENYGEGAVWDFYFLMMVCHEQSHLMQKGEPILNEIAHAILWIDFVFEQGLKPFQVNSDTGKTCNIEAPFILGRNKALKGLNYKLLYEDNLAYFEHEVVDVDYSLFVALTFLVHAGVVRYRYATNLFCGMLAEDDSIARYLRTEAVAHVSSAVSTLVKSNNKLAARDLVKSYMPSFGAIEP